MEFINPIFRPDTLEYADRYLLSVCQKKGRRSIYVPVTFMRYEASPAIVLVKNGEGRLLRIARMDLYGCELPNRD